MPGELEPRCVSCSYLRQDNSLVLAKNYCANDKCPFVSFMTHVEINSFGCNHYDHVRSTEDTKNGVLEFISTLKNSKDTKSLFIHVKHTYPGAKMVIDSNGEIFIEINRRYYNWGGIANPVGLVNRLREMR